MPQLQIRILRDKIAKYGINVEDVNSVIETALAGRSSGVVFEGVPVGAAYPEPVR